MPLNPNLARVSMAYSTGNSDQVEPQFRSLSGPMENLPKALFL